MNKLDCYQTTKLTEYLVSKILRNNVAKGVINSEDNDKLLKIKARLTEEISARLCITPDSLTFNELTSAVEDQVNIDEYLNN